MGHLVEPQLSPTLRLSCNTTGLTSKYLLAGEKGCLTPWHTDLTGSNVCYMVISGKKEFWGLEGTEKNLRCLVDHNHADLARKGKRDLADM